MMDEGRRKGIRSNVSLKELKKGRRRERNGTGKEKREGQKMEVWEEGN